MTAARSPRQADRSAAAAGSAPRASIERRECARHPGVHYHLYLPPGRALPRRVLVLVHGISRRAREQVRLFRRLARRHHTALIAPCFDRALFPKYQSLGWLRGELRADEVLIDILDEVSRLSGLPTGRVALFGYSGGGQFAHRFAMAHPERVSAVGIGAAGWYTLPRPDAPFPRGLALDGADGRPALEPSRFLRIPMAVFVGDGDHSRDEALKANRGLDRSQGQNRIERARAWVTAMREVAARLRIPADYRFHCLPDTAHSFPEAMRRGGLGERLMRFLDEVDQDARGPELASIAPGVNLEEHHRSH